MQHGIHFISGLPRSGSTLLVALLRQNPRFHAEISGPIGPLYMMLQTAMSARHEYNTLIDEDRRMALLRGLFTSYYEKVHPSKVIFDTSRSWCAKLSGLVQLFPDAKVICCVRSTAWIIDSVERIVQQNAFEPSKMFNFESGGNIYNRVEVLTKSGGMIRNPYDALRQAFYGPHAKKLLLVTYESLAARPLSTLASIYRFIREEPFVHDVENVEHSADVYDAMLGTPGLHKVRGKIEYRERRTILPPDIFSKFEDTAFWLDPRKNPNGVDVI